MIWSRSCEYAIRALAHLARRRDGTLVLARRVAEETGMPAPFVAKLMQTMARGGLLRSNKGPQGGFTLRRPAAKVTLMDVVEAIDGTDWCGRCPGGLPECRDDAPCGLHDGWKRVRSSIIDYLEGTSIADVAQPPAAGAKSKPTRRAGRRRPATQR